MTEDGALYYVMEYLDGLDLQTLIENYGRISPERAVHFLLQILESLDEAHRAGLVHRDIKPANIIASKYGVHFDFIKVLDFGLARCIETPGHPGRCSRWWPAHPRSWHRNPHSIQKTPTLEPISTRLELLATGWSREA